MAGERKVGAYVCYGCGIGERLDTDRLEQVAAREGKAGFRQAARRALQPGRYRRRPRRSGVRRGDGRGAVRLLSAREDRGVPVRRRGGGARANLREGVIWSRPDGDSAEAAQEMAEDYVRMACAEVRFMDVPAPSREQTLNRAILVVGGGLGGMTAALESARAGYSVTIVEKTGALGGFAAKLWKRAPDRSPYAEPVDPGVACARERSARARADRGRAEHPRREDLGGARTVLGHPLGRERRRAHRDLRRDCPGHGLHPLRPREGPRSWGTGPRPTSSHKPSSKRSRWRPTERRSPAPPTASRSGACCSCSARGSAARSPATSRTARGTAAPRASSRRCTSRMRTPASRRSSSTRISAPRGRRARTSTVAARTRAWCSPRASPARWARSKAAGRMCATGTSSSTRT